MDTTGRNKNNHLMKKNNKMQKYFYKKYRLYPCIPSITWYTLRVKPSTPLGVIFTATVAKFNNLCKQNY